MDTRTRRLDAWLPAVLIVLGTAVFVGAGRRHPVIGAGLGTVGSDSFFRAFAAEIVHTPNWETMHLMILAGPVLWALGAAGAARLLAARTSALGDLAQGALLLGAAFWGVAFVLDGYVAPAHAAAVTAAGAGADAAPLAAFRVSQLTMARLGMISVGLMGGSILAFGMALLVSARGRSKRTAWWTAGVGVAGVIVGAWPVIATARGEFSPGPFTSPYWTATAVALSLWFLAFGAVLPWVRVDVSASPDAAEPPRRPAAAGRPTFSSTAAGPA